MVELIIISILLGVSLGSFANVCIYRLPRGISIITQRSFCPNCSHQLQWFEMVPVVSYLWSIGNCRYCRIKISLSYPFIELVMAGMTVLVVHQYGITLKALELIFFFLMMVIVVMTDWKHFIIPNQIVIIGLIGGIVLKSLMGRNAYYDALIGSLIAFAILIAIRTIGNFIIKKPSMGWGDIKLAAVVGLYLGFQDFLISLWHR